MGMRIRFYTSWDIYMIWLGGPADRLSRVPMPCPVF
jgi:hypothetical protein